MLIGKKILLKENVKKLFLSKKRIKLASFFIPSKKKRRLFRKFWYVYLNHNRILVIKENGKREFVREYPGVKIIFNGQGSTVVLFHPITFANSYLELGDYSKIKIKNTQHRISVNAYLGDRNTLEIGENFSSPGTSFYLRNEPNLGVKIGKDCMFSWDVVLRINDGHTIYDNTTKKILNKPKSGIFIGNHVWLGYGVYVLKDVQINDNCIVGLRSVVTKSFLDSNNLIAGQPAKVIKHNINWDRQTVSNFENMVAAL